MPTNSTHSYGVTSTSQNIGDLLVCLPWFCSLQNVYHVRSNDPLADGTTSPENQVTPFSLKTCDGQTLYAWHILPLPLYARHEETLAAQSTGVSADITKTENFKLLRDDPEARLIISCKNPKLTPKTESS